MSDDKMREPTAGELGLTGNGDPQFEAVLEGSTGVQLHGDLQDLTNRAVTFIATEVPGLSYVVSSTDQQGLAVKTLDYRQDLPGAHPTRVSGERTVTSMQSFADELTRRPLFGDSTLWASEKAATVQAVYNDHIGAEAGYRDDRLTLQLTRDEDWLSWHGISGKFMAQEDFADTIEELLHTVVVPEQADLMEVIESIRITTGGSFESRISRANGAQTLSYQEEQKATAGKNQQLEIPQTIRLRTRVFDGYPVEYEYDAWFRTRVSGGQLLLAVKLKPTRRLLLAAWTDICREIAADQGRPVLTKP